MTSSLSPQNLTYHVNGGVLELVLLFVVEDEAVLLDVAHHGRLPARALQERDQAVEDPVLKTIANTKLAIYRFQVS